MSSRGGEPVRFLVVDDEELARQDVALLLARVEGVVVAGQLSNGAQALERLERGDIDVVILDITMPVLDGLAVMRQLKTRGSEVRIIVLSGYAEFEYARAALAAGAVDYLLKPIEDEVFRRCVRAVTRGVRERRRALSNAASGWLDTCLDSLEAGTWERLDPSTPPRSEVPLPHVVVAAHHPRELRDHAEDTLSGLFRRARSIHTARARGDGALTVSVVAGEDAADLGAVIDAAARVCLPGRDPVARVSYGVSPLCRGTAEMPDALMRARDSLTLRLTRGAGGLYRRDPGHANPEVATGLVRAGLGEIAEHLRAFTAGTGAGAGDGLARFREITRGVFCPELVEHAGIERLRLAFSEVVAQVAEAFPRGARSISAAVLSGEVIEELETLDEIADYLRDLLRERAGGDGARALNGRELAEEARRHLDSRFHEPLSLTGVAEHLGLSAPYLSELFKERAGVNFVEYLTEVRITQARRLLERTDLPVKEISVAVGYSYPEYFQKVFRKRMGSSPLEYRQTKREGG